MLRINFQTLSCDERSFYNSNFSAQYDTQNDKSFGGYHIMHFVKSFDGYAYFVKIDLFLSLNIYSPLFLWTDIRLIINKALP
jgi:hypothetical protein